MDEGCDAYWRSLPLPAADGGPVVGAAGARRWLPANSAVAQGVVLDRVVAVVNGDVILESDVDEERRFEMIQPYRADWGVLTRAGSVERLIDRTLILQQAALQPETKVSGPGSGCSDWRRCGRTFRSARNITARRMRGGRNIWGITGFTVEEFRDRGGRSGWNCSKFIEVRFRNGVHDHGRPRLRSTTRRRCCRSTQRQKATPPKLDTIAPRVEEVLLQQQVGNASAATG